MVEQKWEPHFIWLHSMLVTELQFYRNFCLVLIKAGTSRTPKDFGKTIVREEKVSRESHVLTDSCRWIRLLMSKVLGRALQTGTCCTEKCWGWGCTASRGSAPGHLRQVGLGSKQSRDPCAQAWSVDWIIKRTCGVWEVLYGYNETLTF